MYSCGESARFVSARRLFAEAFGAEHVTLEAFGNVWAAVSFLHGLAVEELSPAEREVGLLLLKGLSHREVAATRSTTETTIRQQALSIYRKSGLRNRSELSAFFLEDLLLPAGQR